jgi:hypothetical protein
LYLIGATPGAAARSFAELEADLARLVAKIAPR